MTFRLTGTRMSKAFRQVGMKNAIQPIPYDKRKGFIIRASDGVLFISGMEDNDAIVEIGGQDEAEGFIDKSTVRLFGLIGRQSISISFDGDHMIVTEQSERCRSRTRIKITLS